jgi:hypothetical protein
MQHSDYVVKSLGTNSNSSIYQTTKSDKVYEYIPIIAQLSSDPSVSCSTLFAIDGTVAHIICRTNQQIENVIDDDHMLILAQSLDAYVLDSYWNLSKNIFRPA